VAIEVLILGGGPDAEREVSIVSSRGVADALRGLGRFRVRHEIIERLTLGELHDLPGKVVFPVLHGAWGEGGPLQDLLEADGRPYVGWSPRGARAAMDKVATKLRAVAIGVPVLESSILNIADTACPLPLPVVLKPVHEGSSVGVHLCHDAEAWERAWREVVEDMRVHAGRVYMVEAAVIGGRELTVGWLDGEALVPVEIKPAVEFYDYEAKYHRGDTKYVVNPDLPAGVGSMIREHAVRLCEALGARHMARVDFLLDKAGRAWLLEVNTIPGFTPHSLLPMAARHAGLEYAALCERLVNLALRDAGRSLQAE
jgi:D-alanine-D-alanine ligase